MKKQQIRNTGVAFTIGLFTILVIASCKKQGGVASAPPSIVRKVKFILYTDKDFTGDNDTISFKLSIQRANNQTLWDSVLPPMRVKNIPNCQHKLVIEREVPGNDQSTLKVGFNCSIANVGYSWFFDWSAAGETFKEVVFNFK